MIDQNGKLFGLINIIDFIVLALIGLSITGVIFVKYGYHKTSAQIVEKVAPIEFEIFSRGQKMKSPDDLFKGIKTTFLTIRNVPYTEVDVVSYECTPWQLAIPNPETNTAVAVDDPSAPMTWDCALRLRDKASITSDGPALGGNKIKVGLRVDFEGFNYRLPGVISDVTILDGKQ